MLNAVLVHQKEKKEKKRASFISDRESKQTIGCTAKIVYKGHSREPENMLFMTYLLYTGLYLLCLQLLTGF